MHIPNLLGCNNCQKFGHRETKCIKSAICKKCGESGSDHIELTCSNPIKCANCQSDHPADLRICLVWKREKEINTIKYTQNISFPEARKIVRSQNQFQTKSYSQVTKSNREAKHNHSCYKLYNHIHQAGDKASGGSSIILNNSIPQSQIQLNTNLQAVAVKATVHKTIYVCSLYLPPSDRINVADLEHLIQQLPKPFIIMGDFNSHSNIWGCSDTDQKGRIIDVSNRNNLLI